MTAVYVQGGDPEPEPEPSGAGLPVQLTARSGLAFHKTSTGVKTPQLVKYLPRGYRDIDHMLSGEFWWAHRGGSASFPEHALWSYTQSALIGYGALEISLNRTSDGVWFGLHDSTLDRTSGVSGIDPTSLTWAQVQQYQIIIGASGAPKPYMRLEELAAVYGSTHIIIVDPKYRHSTHRAEFFTKIGQLLDKSRTIVKFSYDNVSFRDMAKAQGWKTWGYGYAENLINDPNWSTRMSGWDILGMEYSASQTVWNQVKALGRPVVAHICPTQASVDSGRAKGANGFQCSGVAGIIPLR